jgi:hypothetical protein
MTNLRHLATWASPGYGLPDRFEGAFHGSAPDGNSGHGGAPKGASDDQNRARTGPEEPLDGVAHAQVGRLVPPMAADHQKVKAVLFCV